MHSKSEKAENFLNSVLCTHQPILSTEVYKKAKMENISQRTVKSVKKQMDIQSLKIGCRWYFVDSIYIKEKERKENNVSKKE